MFHTGWFTENLVALGVAMLLLRGRGRGRPACGMARLGRCR
ncbi:hypothetical protein [Actinomadura sp. 7K507]|nr:hypothetical protein [Actinomadura sp. 7K507]